MSFPLFIYKFGGLNTKYIILASRNLSNNLEYSLQSAHDYEALAHEMYCSLKFTKCHELLWSKFYRIMNENCITGISRHNLSLMNNWLSLFVLNFECFREFRIENKTITF